MLDQELFQKYDIFYQIAEVVEMVDTEDLKSSGPIRAVPVQVRSSAGFSS